MSLYADASAWDNTTLEQATFTNVQTDFSGGVLAAAVVDPPLGTFGETPILPTDDVLGTGPMLSPYWCDEVLFRQPEQETSRRCLFKSCDFPPDW